MNGREGSWASAVRGPITLITLGALFALNNLAGIGFGKTWPVLLIVFGLLSLLSRSEEPPRRPPAAPFPPNYPHNQPPPPATHYTGSPYSQPPQGSAPPSNPPSGENV